LRVIRLEVSVYSVYITNPFQAFFAGKGGGGGKILLVDVTVKNNKNFGPDYIQEFGLWT
jgi:hypothetical protein